MSAATKRTLLAAVSMALVGAITFAGAAGGAPSGKRDRTPPTPPQNVHVVAATPLAVSTAWDPSQDDVGVAGYYVYYDTGRAIVSSPAYTVGGLECGYSTAISVAAFDKSGNRSPRVSATIATAACPDVQPPTTPSGFRQAATTQKEAVLAWNVSSDDVGVVGYGVYRNLARIASPADPTVTLTGLACGSTYTYAVDAADATGNRSLLGTAYVQTASCADGQPPSAPADLAVTAKTQTSISTSWSPSSDDVGVAGYHVRVGGSLVSTGTQTSSTISNLACGVTYTVGVDAFDAAGNQSPATTASVATDACSTPPPPPPTDTTPPAKPILSLGPQAQTTLQLNWQAGVDNVGVDHYNVWLAHSGANDFAQIAQVPASQLSFVYGGLTCATGYLLGLEVVDAVGNKSSIGEATFGPVQTLACSAPPPPPPPSGDTTPPARPTLSLGPQAQTTLQLNWQAGVDNVGVDHYNVWLGHDGGSDFAQIAQVPASQLSFVYGGLTCATAYLLGLEVVDAAGNKSQIGEATFGPVQTLACSSPPPPSGDTTPPAQPTGLAVSAATGTSVSLTWTASTDNVGVMGYTVYRNGASAQTPSQPGATIAALACGTAYTFEVDAYDAAGNRSARAAMTTSTSACSDTQPPASPTNVTATSRTASSIALSWSASSDNVGVTGYGLFRGGAQVGTSTSTTGIFSSLTCNTNYTLAVDANDAAGNRSAQTVVMVSTTACADTTPPSTPTGLAASNISQTGLTLTWNAASDNVGVTGYDVYRNATKMATASSTSSSQTGLACGTSYAFAVAALDAAGNSSQQGQLNASTSACSTPPPPTGDSANLWVDTNGGTCTRSTGTAYVDAQACGLFSAALSAAQAGDTVKVRGGTYGQQVLSSNKGAQPVTFVEASGESVTLQTTWPTPSLQLNSGAGNLAFRDISIGWLDSAGSNIVFERIDFGTLEVHAGSNVSFVGGDIGPAISTPSLDAHPVLPGTASNVVFDGVYFHDVGSTGGAHTECLLVYGVDGLVIRNSRFFNCDSTGALYVTRLNVSGSHPVVENVLIENNFFLDDTGYTAGPNGTQSSQIWHVQLENDAEIIFRNNTVTKRLLLLDRNDSCPSCGDPLRPIVIQNNYGSLTDCSLSGVIGGGNVWVEWQGYGSSFCSGDSPPISGGLQVVNIQADLHLLPGANAIGRAIAGPATDIDGEARTGATDAGADER